MVCLFVVLLDALAGYFFLVCCWWLVSGSCLVCCGFVWCWVGVGLLAVDLRYYYLVCV